MLFVVLFLSLALVALIGVAVVFAVTRATAWVVQRVEARDDARSTAPSAPDTSARERVSSESSNARSAA